MPRKKPYGVVLEHLSALVKKRKVLKEDLIRRKVRMCLADGLQFYGGWEGVVQPWYLAVYPVHSE